MPSVTVSLDDNYKKRLNFLCETILKKSKGSVLTEVIQSYIDNEEGKYKDIYNHVNAIRNAVKSKGINNVDDKIVIKRPIEIDGELARKKSIDKRLNKVVSLR